MNSFFRCPINLTNYLRIVTFLLLLNPSSSFSQGIFQGCVSANFGIDGDVNSNQLILLTGLAGNGTDDWFKIGAGSGIGLIDTTGAASIYGQLSSNPAFVNRSFTRYMNYGYFEYANGNTMLDAVFYRDYFGGIASGNNNIDSTIFIGSSKNADSPAQWVPGAGSITSLKADILDVYAHSRRIGDSISGDMWLFSGASVASPSGDRYLDFEFFNNKISYNGSSFQNLGPDEGRLAYTFDNSGKILSGGDVIFSISGNNTVTLEVRVWVSRSTYNAFRLSPPANLPFRFGTSFIGNANTSAYGYANIIPINSSDYVACGYTNSSSSVPAGPWGTINIVNASGNPGYRVNYGMNYAAGQFVEIGLNLSSLGIDPLSITEGGDPCGDAFQVFFVKTRSSSSFTSQLQDFAGPINLANPKYSVSITSDKPFSCDNEPVTLKGNVLPYASGNLYYYTWTLPDGTVLSGTRLDSITVTNGGIYKLGVSPIQNCRIAATDSFNLIIDYQPTVSSGSSVSAPICYGRGVNADIVSGSGFHSCADTYEWRMDGGAWQPYVSGVTVGANASDFVEISVVRECLTGCIERDTQLRWEVADPIILETTSSLSNCADLTGYVAVIEAINPSPSIGIWTIASGPGQIYNQNLIQTMVTGLSTTGNTTNIEWVVTDIWGCRDTAEMDITPPVINPNNVSKFDNEYCLSCPVSIGGKYYFYDNEGRILAAVEKTDTTAANTDMEFCARLTYPLPGNPNVTDVPLVPSSYAVVQPYLPRYWSVQGGETTINVDLYFTDEELASLMGYANGGSIYSFTNVNALFITYYENNGSSFITPGSPGGILLTPTFIRLGNYWQVSFSVPGSSTFYLHPIEFGGAPLPVELVSMSATPKSNAIMLDWQTMSERNCDRFEIERSTNGISFSYIGEVSGAGTSNVSQAYQFEDANVMPGTTYFYRLLIADFDGSYEKSKMVFAIMPLTSDFFIGEFVPNPVKNYTSVKLMTDKDYVLKFTLFSINGKEIMKRNINLQNGMSMPVFNFSNIPAGTYTGHFTTPNGWAIRKLIKID